MRIQLHLRVSRPIGTTGQAKEVDSRNVQTSSDRPAVSSAVCSILEISIRTITKLKLSGLSSRLCEHGLVDTVVGSISLRAPHGKVSPLRVPVRSHSIRILNRSIGVVSCFVHLQAILIMEKSGVLKACFGQ